MSPRARLLLRSVLGVSMIGIGVLHFARPAPFVSIVPAYLPHPYALVLVSGVFEVLLGAGLFPERTRRLASAGLVLLYLGVFPANVNMAMNGVSPEGLHVAPWAAWARLPFQAVLIALALVAGRRDAARGQGA